MRCINRKHRGRSWCSLTNETLTAGVSLPSSSYLIHHFCCFYYFERALLLHHGLTTAQSFGVASDKQAFFRHRQDDTGYSQTFLQCHLNTKI